MVARVEWKLNKFDDTIHYVDLTFGGVISNLNGIKPKQR